eukprot:1147818-Pelagomonas_calceolata.AAC.5
MIRLILFSSGVSADVPELVRRLLEEVVVVAVVVLVAGASSGVLLRAMLKALAPKLLRGLLVLVGFGGGGAKWKWASGPFFIGSLDCCM